MLEVLWSIHKETKRFDTFDTARRANALKLWCITHDDITATIMFEMNHNDYVKAAIVEQGKLYKHWCFFLHTL